MIDPERLKKFNRGIARMGLTPAYDDGQGVVLFEADCRDVVASMPASVVSSVVTDPPYGIGFMGKGWDHGVPGEEFWRAFLRVSKPGAFCLSFCATRMYHRLGTAIEDADWELRDMIAWVYGSGFPKSLDVSIAIDKAAGVVGPRGSAFNSAGAKERSNGGDALRSDHPEYKPYEPTTPEAQLWNGWGTALKPAFEPICVAMKSLDGTFANNALTHGVAGLNVDGCRVGVEGGTKRSHQAGYNENGWRTGHEIEPLDAGRWPANLVHDGDDEVLRLFPVTENAPTPSPGGFRGDSGSAARFFYCAKPSQAERGEGNNHSTVKPRALMEWLLRLTMTPTGGIVLDPFCGSGTTLLAARKVGRPIIGCELNQDPDVDSIDICIERLERDAYDRSHGFGIS